METERPMVPAHGRLWNGNRVLAAEELPANVDVYYDQNGALRVVRGALRRDTPTFRMGMTVRVGEYAERLWVNGLVVRSTE